MDNSIYIVLSKQTALFREMAVVANNVANASSPGYHSQGMLFEQFVTNNGGQHKEAFTQDISTYTNHTPGPMLKTDRKLDVAIEGQGFFLVETPLGQRYTRGGNFTVNAQGILATSQGYPVLSAEGQRIEFAPEDVEIVIAQDGAVRANGDPRGVIGVVVFANPQLAKRLPDGTYNSTEQPQAAEPGTYKVAQGVIEESNVSPVVQLTELIEVSRSAGSSAKYLNDMHELERKALSSITKIG